ncbi:regulatory LuxR family protein [Pseudonocardia hierapolitana]|uniref:Regulatory LuxR family protein n=1 Tax=Pseudonocardia hierapolitana TaxID=1128676 RepID=A0A561SWM6_9PSEU|nr:LuxR family transcriptional regulator [Pseudonocardia hierapolitana]TWF79266.1 regulatory LuxR family protein [Pseudonocardia hierapolitana]
MLLLGRSAECATVDQMLARARDGRSGALVVRGEAGIGKTALLEHARDAASGFRVRQVAGVEAEMPFAFAALHQLCAPLLDRLATLPGPQQTALGVALGQIGGDPPDRFLVGLATLGLLAEAAAEQPLLCLIDDVQWLDPASAQTLGFVARRVEAEHLALIFARRDPAPGTGNTEAFTGLPQLRPNRLGDADARTLLAEAVHAPLDARVHDRILAEARGNPLALRELARSTRPARTAALAGGFGLPDALTVPDRVEESFRQRSESLPTATRLLLLTAAADPTGDTALLLRAAAHLGIGADAAAPAEEAGLLEIGTQVRFPHPLARSAVYRAAAPPDRRRAHHALAAVTDPQTDPDRRAWHHAQSVLGTDETAAVELERSADRARTRGGLSSAAAFLERAAALSPEPAGRARRALAAASAKHEAGDPEAASGLLTVAAAGPPDALHAARVDLLRAQVAFHLTRGNDAPGMLLTAAAGLAPLDAALSREAYLQALEASIIAGARTCGRGIGEVAEAARTAPAPPAPPRPVDVLLDGLVTYYLHGYETGVPGFRRTLETFLGLPPSAGDLRWLWLGCHTAMALWDDAAGATLAGRHLRLARDAGALATLPFALTFHATLLAHAGELTRVSELIAETDAITRATGAAPLPYARLMLAAWRGRRAEASTLHTAAVQDANERGEGTAITVADSNLAVLHNGLGGYAAALDAAERVWESGELVHSTMALPELIEAAVRSGAPERASAALAELRPRARACGTPWALGLEARSRALTSAGPAAEAGYREAIEHLGGCRMAAHLARAHLVYGEWLRREGRRRDSREQLRIAHDQLTASGADGFAARAARELRATGDQPRERSDRPATGLTEHELHIARLVATGATSKEIGAQLFLSPRTIETHLRNIFRKLGITSRHELRTMQLS